MKTSKKVGSWQELHLSPALFWDTDASKINLDTHAKTIVERVIMHGTWLEFKAILEYYGKDRVKEILIQLRYHRKLCRYFILYRLECLEGCWWEEPYARVREMGKYCRFGYNYCFAACMDSCELVYLATVKRCFPQERDGL